MNNMGVLYSLWNRTDLIVNKMYKVPVIRDDFMIIVF